RTVPRSVPGGVIEAASASSEAAFCTSAAWLPMPSAIIRAIFAPAISGLPEPLSGPSLAGEKGSTLRILEAMFEATLASLPNMDWMPWISPSTTFRPALISRPPRLPTADLIRPGIDLTIPSSRSAPLDAPFFSASQPRENMLLSVDQPDENSPFRPFHIELAIDLIAFHPAEKKLLMPFHAAEVRDLIVSHAAEAADFSAFQNAIQAVLIASTAAEKVAFTSSKSPKMIALITANTDSTTVRI